MVDSDDDLSNPMAPRLGWEGGDKKRCTWPLDCTCVFFGEDCVALHQTWSSATRTILDHIIFLLQRELTQRSKSEKTCLEDQIQHMV